MSENASNSRQFLVDTIDSPFSTGVGIVSGVGAFLFEYSNVGVFGDTVLKNDKQITNAESAQGDTESHPASPQAQQQLRTALALPSGSQTKNLEVIGIMTGSAAVAGLLVALGAHGVSRWVSRHSRAAV